MVIPCLDLCCCGEEEEEESGGGGARGCWFEGAIDVDDDDDDGIENERGNCCKDQRVVGSWLYHWG